MDPDVIPRPASFSWNAAQELAAERAGEYTNFMTKEELALLFADLKLALWGSLKDTATLPEVQQQLAVDQTISQTISQFFRDHGDALGGVTPDYGSDDQIAAHIGSLRTLLLVTESEGLIKSIEQDLTPLQRTLLVRHVVGGMSLADLSKAYGRSEQDIRAALGRLVAVLRLWLPQGE
jgi:hypothetical protein